MPQGHDHDERIQKFGAGTRSNNTPPDDDDTDLDGDAQEAEGAAPEKIGSEVAPTKQAEARERERHRLEREAGRIPGGEGVARDTRAPGVTREDLDEAARQADRNVVGHEVPSRSPGGRS
jgi:hypothetical protein